MRVYQFRHLGIKCMLSTCSGRCSYLALQLEGPKYSALFDEMETTFDT
jgi:hypothetical protein